jgi:hypothetical protein
MNNANYKAGPRGYCLKMNCRKILNSRYLTKCWIDSIYRVLEIKILYRIVSNSYWQYSPTTCGDHQRPIVRPNESQLGQLYNQSASVHWSRGCAIGCTIKSSSFLLPVQCNTTEVFSHFVRGVSIYVQCRLKIQIGRLQVGDSWVLKLFSLGLYCFCWKFIPDHAGWHGVLRSCKLSSLCVARGILGHVLWPAGMLAASSSPPRCPQYDQLSCLA